MGKKMVCWKCGAELLELILPMSRREECSVCTVDQHVCMMCRHYNPHVANKCEHDRADLVADKERANFCDYFKPKPNAYQAKDKKAELETRRKLAELFGDELPVEEVDESPLAEADAALAQLKKMFADHEDSNPVNNDEKQE